MSCEIRAVYLDFLISLVPTIQVTSDSIQASEAFLPYITVAAKSYSTHCTAESSFQYRVNKCTGGLLLFSSFLLVCHPSKLWVTNEFMNANRLTGKCSRHLEQFHFCLHLFAYLHQHYKITIYIKFTLHSVGSVLLCVVAQRSFSAFFSHAIKSSVKNIGLISSILLWELNCNFKMSPLRSRKSYCAFRFATREEADNNPQNELHVFWQYCQMCLCLLGNVLCVLFR